jgi:F-type H+-transporting ATPase subunit b
LENAHTSIRNSLRADLEQISATLLKEPENER